MPNLPSSKKALRQSKKREVQNRGYKNRVKKLQKEIETSVKNGDKAKAEGLVPSFYKAVDKATKRNILHKNTAARKKATINKQVVNADTKPQEEAAAENNSQAK